MSMNTFDPYTPVSTPETDLDTDLDGEDALDEQASAPFVAPESDGAASPSGRGAASRGMSRAAIRRIATKAQEVTETDERVVALAASILGSGTGLGEITTAIMAAPRGATAAITDLDLIVTADPLEAGIIATAMGRDRLRAVWGLLNALADSESNLPAAAPKAALAVVKAALTLDEVAQAEIAAVSALLKKN